MANSLTTVDLQPTYVYNQYQSEDWLKIFFQTVDKEISKNYMDKLEDYIDAINIKDSMSEFLTYYTRNYLGMDRPLGGASVGQYWDSGILYDSNITQEKKLQYDDSDAGDGLITQEQYLKFIKFVYDYSIVSLNIIDIVKFVADYCLISPMDVEVSYTERQIILYLPQSAEVVDFIKLIIIERDSLCLPFGIDTIDFRVKM